ncbi:response regulator transcription factor [Nitrospirales bacterium NOB]|mgnify:CR=1 FL=1|nr:MAG: LuxR family response regulator [Nitrospira sp. OLB3]MBV6468787.1 Oxygen regulatory protein NreC [Nitrospirota bacterium]MCE7964120.1 DNA-binding response regulator [Nitrospira sp. NTP2]MCK6493544.1 response regulator transcription factor [Nitrospira sp.]MDL1889293.1 response regulator transcription factor [Nitrospirales bacterium NOB]MEB2337030.1 response regulator transcription factor [Nitrospirales bacterium]
MKKVRVLLADDHTLVRAGFRALLEKLDGIQVIDEVSNGRDALRIAKEREPEVVLMDIAMPEMNGLEATIRMRQECPQTRVLMLSMYTNEEYLKEALRAGAAGYLLKDADRAELELAIKTVCRGETYLTPSVVKFTLDAYRRQDDSQLGPLGRLTGRQREILQLIAEGWSTKQIAQRLDLSVKTVETHRAQLMERLEIHDVPGLVRLAIRTGLVRTDS